MKDKLSKRHIQKYLTSDAIEVTVLKSVPSTNTLLREWAKNGETEGTLIVTDHQTAGRGRRGRSFYSPAGTGLYMSLLLQPAFECTHSVYLTTACAVAACEAVEAIGGPKLGIKWVNDLFLEGKKVGGILTEATEDGIIVGIGINLYPPKNGFPAELANIAAPIYASPVKNLKNRLVAEWVERFWKEYQNLTPENFLGRYRERSVLLGKTIRVMRAEGEFTATAIGINDRFELQILTDSGEEMVLYSGEVSVRQEIG